MVIHYNPYIELNMQESPRPIVYDSMMEIYRIPETQRPKPDRCLDIGSRIIADFDLTKR